MQSVLTALAAQHATLAGLLEPLDEKGWHRPTRCEGWDVADVVLHLAQTDELAVASAQGRFGDGLHELASGVDRQVDVDEGAGAMVARERGLADADLFGRWSRDAAALRDALAAGDPHARVEWVAGLLSLRTLATTRLSECWIHTGDVAEALGIEQEPTDDLEHIARLAWRTLPYAFARDGRQLAGPVAFRLRGPSGSRWDFEPDRAPVTVVEGDGAELCLVAARRVTPNETALRAEGPDAATVLDLVRTYA